MSGNIVDCGSVYERRLVGCMTDERILNILALSETRLKCKGDIHLVGNIVGIVTGVGNM